MQSREVKKKIKEKREGVSFSLFYLIFHSLFPKRSLRARILNSLLDDAFDLIPVAGVDALDLRVEVSLDGIEDFPFQSVRDEGDGDANTAETACTTDTVEVGLVVCLAGFTSVVDFGDVLIYVSIYIRSRLSW